MKNNSTQIILTIISAIVLFLLTITQFGNLFTLLLPKIDNLMFSPTSIGGQFRIRLLFSMVVGLTPISIYLTWRLSPISNTKKKTISGLIILVSMAFAIFLRQQSIKSAYSGMTNLKNQTSEIIFNSFSIENLHFEYYLLIGLILGCVVSFFTLKDK